MLSKRRYRRTTGAVYVVAAFCLPFLLLDSIGCRANEEAVDNIFTRPINGTESKTNGAINKQEPLLLWSSTGGGWRAMFGDVGYANLFRQAGLFDNTSSKFNGISTVSGASWFSTQLFYSQAFYDQVIGSETPEALESFVLTWMASYAEMAGDIDPEGISACSQLGPDQARFDRSTELREDMQGACELAYQEDQDWAQFVQKMLDEAVRALDGNTDGAFSEIRANGENRIPALQETNLLVQSALFPVSRIRNESDSTVVYVGYGNHAFVPVLSAAWVVDGTSANAGGFWYGTDDATPSLWTYTKPMANELDWDDWEAFDLYEPPNDEGSLTTDIRGLGVKHWDYQVRPPFGGFQNTTVTKIASISSAAAGQVSPLNPSVFVQWQSLLLYTATADKWSIWAKVGLGVVSGLLVAGLMVLVFRERTSRLCAGCCAITTAALVGTFVSFGTLWIPALLNRVMARAYEAPALDELSVCSQWPNPCGPADFRFTDGWFVDNPAVAINLGHHIRSSDSNEKLRLIVTNMNQIESWDSDFYLGQILVYFDTVFNQGVDPGGFLWGPGMYAPYRSPQVFADSLSRSELIASLDPIPDSNMTTAVFSNLTTIDNPAFGIVAGRTVDVLLLNLNVSMTTYVVGKPVIDRLTQPLADMTTHVAFNEVLLERVKKFVGGTSDATDDNSSNNSETPN